MFVTQTVAVMLRLMQANYNAAFEDVTPLHLSFPTAYAAQLALKVRSASDSKGYLHIISEHKTKPTVLK